MIYRYHTFEIYPWGAILNLKCIEANKQVYTVGEDEGDYSTSTSYNLKYGYLGSGRSYFIESKEQPIIMKFENKFKNNKSVNGDIVSISSNMTITTNETYKISGDNNNYIKKFTVDNTSWFDLPYPSQTTTIERISTSSQVQLLEEPYSGLSFTKNGSTISSRDWVSKGNRIYYFNVNGRYDNVPVNTEIVANYNYLHSVIEDKVKVIEPSSTSLSLRAYVVNQPIQTEKIYNKGVVVNNYNIAYDSQLKKYYYYFMKRYNEVSIGDELNIVYKISSPKEEILITEEVLESVIHRGTLSNGNENKPIEDCKDSNGKYVFYTRDINNKQYIYLKTDTYDNENLTVRFEKERPYVKLYCNNVKVETRMVELGGLSNGFSQITKDDDYIYPSSDIPALYGLKAKLLRKIKISWSKSEYNQLYYGETNNSGSGFGYNQYEFYGFYNNTNLQLKYINSHSENSYSYTIPAIKDLNSPYYSIGYVVNFGGEGLYACNTQQYINNKILGYTNKGYLIKLNERKDINREYYSGVPSLTTLEKWGSNNSFYTSGYDDNITYISPSDGYELLTDWSVEYICGDCAECGECGECGQGGGTEYAVVKGSGASGYEIWPPSGNPKYWVPGGTETLASNYSPLSGGGYYFTWTSSWGEPVSAWVYSDNVEIVER